MPDTTSKEFNEAVVKIAAEGGLTPATAKTLAMYAADAPNWSGSPWVNMANFTVTKAMRGNLSDLVKKGLIVISDYEGKGRAKDMVLDFTETGKALVEAAGFELQ